MSDLWQDLRYSVRNMRKRALLSTVVIATLTLGVGFSTGVFTLINAIYLRAPVDKDHDSFIRVYSAYTYDPTRPGPAGNTTLEDYLAFRDQAKSLRKLAAYAEFDAPFGHDDPVEVRASLVTPDFFSLYDLEQPLMGRLLLPEDCSAANPVVVLSERLWRNQFASDPQIVGKVVHFNGQPVTVVGLAPNFAGMGNGSRAWFPYTLESYLKLGDSLLKPGQAAWLMVIGRLNPGFSRQEAAAELRLLASQQERLHPGRISTITVTDGSFIQEPVFRGRMIWTVTLIMGTLTFLVLIVCANVATLLLARAAGRRQEIALRLALGAARMRLVRMLLTETILLASIAGLASLYSVWRLPKALMLWILEDNIGSTAYYSLAPDWRVFSYQTLITLLAALLVGLTPAYQSLKVNLSDSLKDPRNSLGGAAGGSWLQGLLIGAQVALSFVLVFGAGLAVSVFHKMSGANPGFETRQALIVQMYLRDRSAKQQPWGAQRRILSERLEALPGVQSVAFASRRLFDYRSPIDVYVPGRAKRQVAMNWVSQNFFTTLVIPIVSGRAFEHDESSCKSDRCPIVVSQKLAKEFWPDENPLGKTLQDSRGTTFEVVGVASDVSTQRLGAPDDPLIYALWNPNAGLEAHFPFVRFSGDVAVITRAVIATAQGMSPEISVRAQTIQSQIELTIKFIERLGMLVILLGAIAVTLAVIGIYGIVSFAVAQRTKEMGIRIALGAGKTYIYSAILKSSGRPVALGLLIGLGMTLAVAAVLAQILRSAPLAVNVYDPINYAITAILLAAVALAAMIGPARRAVRVDPTVALRYE